MKIRGVSQTLSAILIAAFALAETAAAQAPIRVRNPNELQGALSRVREGGVIEMAAGTYRAPANGFSFGNLRKSFTVRAAAGAAVVLDGEGARPILRFKNRNLAQNKAIVFQGLTFANGVATANNDAGGVSLAAAEARFVGCIFRNNRSDAPTGGGGVHIFDGSLVSFIGCEFRDNTAKANGGAISLRSSTAYVQGGLLSGNRVNLPGHSPASAGGAIFVVDGTLRVSEARFEGNQAGWVGGAIYAIGSWVEPLSSPRTDVLVNRSTFSGNRAVSDPCCPAPGPTTGGALHAENQATMRVQGSSFVRNEAEFGGAIDAFRSILEVGGSIFQGNQATLNSDDPAAGGAILALSNDEVVDAVNRRPVRLRLTDSLLQGRLGTGPPAASVGGCLLAAGDESRMYGANGIAQAGTLAENRAPVEIRNVIFSDCDVVAVGTGGSGGAVEASLVDLTMEDSLILDSDAGVLGAGGNAGFGGGISLQNESNARIARTTLAGNTAQSRGGGLSLSGSFLQMSQSNFFGNDAGTDDLANSRGAAIFTSPLLAAARPRDVGGVVTGSVFSDNPGLPIWEAEPQGSGPINDVRYDGNRIFPVSFENLVYMNTFTDPGRQGSTAGELNDLVVFRPHRPPTDKSLVPNQFLTSPPAAGALLAAPSGLRAGAPGATAAARLGFAWSGFGASLAGQPLPDRAGLAAVTAPGDFTLAVDGSPLATARVTAASCTGGPVLCALGGRFRIEVRWRDAALSGAGGSGAGQAVSVSDPAGYFWFFDPASVEMVVKVLDNRSSTGSFGVYIGGLSSVETTVTVFDTVTGRVRTYTNPAGRLAAIADVRAFPAAAVARSLAAEEDAAEEDLTAAVSPLCAAGPGQLCLAGGRIRAELSWRDPRTGRVQAARAEPLTGSAGYFWFHNASNPEVAVKVIDGRALNGNFWVFYGALSSEQYTLTVTDTETGRRKIYNNPAGRLASVGDTAALRQ